MTRVIWITGLSAAGKSQIGAEVVRLLGSRGTFSLLLDGDAVREAVADPAIRHDRASRLANAHRISRLARMLAAQGLTVVVATMSLFHEVHAWNRANLPGYFEVLIDVDLDVLKQRDPKALYAGAGAGRRRNVGGIDLAVELPRSPHLVIDNNSEGDDASTQALRIIQATSGDGD